MARRKRPVSRGRPQRGNAKTDRTRLHSKRAVTTERQSDGTHQPGSEEGAQKPQFEWVEVEHRDAAGNPTFPKQLIASTVLRRYGDVPEDTEIRVLVLAGYRPKALMLVERKIYEIHRFSVQGWRRSGQIAVEIEGWRHHESEWFGAMRRARLEVSNPGLPGPHNEKTNYLVSDSSFRRKIVTSVGAGDQKSEIHMYEGTLDITETWRSAWRRQAAEVLNMGFKYLLIPVLASLLAGLAVWWIVSS